MKDIRAKASSLGDSLLERLSPRVSQGSEAEVRAAAGALRTEHPRVFDNHLANRVQR